MKGAMGNPNGNKDERSKRLAEELRKNLRRRKGQAREQREAPKPETD